MHVQLAAHAAAAPMLHCAVQSIVADCGLSTRSHGKTPSKGASLYGQITPQRQISTSPRLLAAHLWRRAMTYDVSTYTALCPSLAPGEQSTVSGTVGAIQLTAALSFARRHTRTQPCEWATDGHERAAPRPAEHCNGHE